MAKKLVTTKKKLSKAQDGGWTPTSQMLVMSPTNYTDDNVSNRSKLGIVKKVKEKVSNIKEKVKATLKKSKKPSRYETYQNPRFLD
jgi:hypothetical protein